MKKLLVIALVIPAALVGGCWLTWAVWRLMRCCNKLPPARLGTIWVCRHGRPWRLTRVKQMDQRLGPPVWVRTSRRAALKKFKAELHADLERMATQYDL